MGDGSFCPTGLVTVLRQCQGMTLWVPGGHSLTVLGTTSQRTYAKKSLLPVMLRVIKRFRGAVIVHVTYCEACGERLLPARRGAALTSEHVNGGVSMGQSMGVMVFRRQDAQKVLVHELIHLFGMDEPLRGLDPNVEAGVVHDRKGFWSWGPHTFPIGLNEAYTDALACIIYCDGDLVRARRHAVLVAARVLAHFRWGALPFCESTHAFSYYVVKAALLVALDARGVTALMTAPLNRMDVVGFMAKGLRADAFHDSLLSARRVKDRGGGRGRGIQMTDGRPMVF